MFSSFKQKTRAGSPAIPSTQIPGTCHHPLPKAGLPTHFSALAAHIKYGNTVHPTRDHREVGRGTHWDLVRKSLIFLLMLKKTIKFEVEENV